MQAEKKLIPLPLYKKIHASVPVLCVDVVVVNSEGHFLLVKRANEPEKGKWWFLGGRVFRGERVKEAALRKVKEETGLSGTIKKELGHYEYLSKKGYFKSIGAHMFAIVFLVKIDSRKTVHLDGQSSEFKWFSGVEPTFNSYIKDFLKRAGFKARK